jgi:membrane protease YdiL (CAAX protease family)
LKRRLALAAFTYCALLLTLGIGFHRAPNLAGSGLSFPRAFASFALLLAPLWFFGFGGAEPLKNLGSRAKILCAGWLALPYFVFTIGTPDFQPRVALMVIALPVLLAAFLELPKLLQQMTWRDVAVLGIVVASYFLKWLHGAWPQPALAVFPKLFLADIVLYCFLVTRRLEGSGYSLSPSKSAVMVGLREWVFYLPFAITIGELTGFIHFHATAVRPARIVASALITFLLIALPEELFFRAVLQNLLETRLARNLALLVASIFFGLSHFNHGAAFNWRYVLLASMAGLFYGRAWRQNRQVFAAITTHTAVDVVWSLWFR